MVATTDGATDRAALRALRLAAHGLMVTAATPTAAVSRLLAVQAQEVVAPLFAIGLRSGACRADVEAAFERGDLIRSWTMRGTLHVIAPADLRWLLALTGERVLGATRSIRAREGVTDEVLDAAAVVADRELAGDGPDGRSGLRRGDLLERFAAAGIPVAGNRGYHVLLALALRGVLCIGARAGTQYRFHLVRDRVPDELGEPVDRDEALGRLAERYLAGHGPATDRDLAFWSGLTLTDARRALQVAAPVLETLDADGIGYVVLRTAVEKHALDRHAARATASRVLALPGFDEYYLGYADRSPVLAKQDQQQVTPGANGRFLPIIVADGRVVATWSPLAESPRVQPIGVLDAPAAKAAERAAAEATAWLGGAST